MEYQMELGLMSLCSSMFLDENLAFWSMQGLVNPDSFGHYRMELSVDMTEEEGDWLVQQLAGLGDRAESPPVSEYWEKDGELGPEYDKVLE